MRLQYIGDSKDSFKWDYLHYLTSELKYPLLNIALMMTPGDNTSHGNTDPQEFSKEILQFCKELKKIKERRAKGRAKSDKKYVEEFIQKLKNIPELFNADYKINIHKGLTYFSKSKQNEYFTGFDDKKQIIFVDPDIGLEPQKPNEKHITYAEVEVISQQISDDSIIVIFQHSKRNQFAEHFQEIKSKFQSGYSAAIYKDAKVMFIAVTKKSKIIKSINGINNKYTSKQKQKNIAQLKLEVIEG